MTIGLAMIVAGVLPMPAVYLLRRFQILKVDLDIHQGSIRRNETTASTKQMMDDDDVSNHIHNFPIIKDSLTSLLPKQMVMSLFCFLYKSSKWSYDFHLSLEQYFLMKKTRRTRNNQQFMRIAIYVIC